MKIPDKPVGLTKDAGWQFGLRKTVPYSLEAVWDFLFSAEGLKHWLGTLEEELEIKKPFNTNEGVEGMIRLLTPYSHVRMSWKKNGWKNTSTVQVRVLNNGEKTTISFHHEKLLNEQQREEVQGYWNEKMTALETALAKTFEPK
ncbi:MAG: SRPBCC domain-containing protein [Crocinitomicaceae bacterium]|nr:SRPBCC domain-containing protein [Crocinitomicaceae bacterium]